MEIQLEELNQCGRKPLFIHDRTRLATATSVKLLDDRTLVTASFVGQRMYLVRLNERRNRYEILDSLDTTFAGELAETDLMEADDHGNIVTSNFYLGSATLYRRKGKSLEFVRDLPLGLESFVHGLRFYKPDILAIAVTKGRRGVHFFNIETCEHLFHIEIDCKTQDVFFLSENRALVILAHGAPKTNEQSLYHSELQIHEFDLDRKTSRVVARSILDECHIDNCARHNHQLLLTDQLNDQLTVIDGETLEVVERMPGFDFPHGIDVRDGLLAVTNYGTNSVAVRRLQGRPVSSLRRVVQWFASHIPGQRERQRAA